MIIYLLLHEKFLRMSKDIIFKFNLLKNRALKYTNTLFSTHF